MKILFRYRWAASIGITILAALIFLVFLGTLDIFLLFVILALSAIVLSYPSFAERRWQARGLPPESIHVPVHQIQKGKDFLLLKLFEMPQVYQWIKNRYSLRMSDAGAPGLFLYIYLPTWLYEMRNTGPEAVYQFVAAKLKKDLEDPQDLDLIAQRNLPLSFGFRFLPKHDFPYHELSRTIDIVKKEYFRENTRIKGILQSKRRLFRMHAPDDNEWRTFQPYQEETSLLYGGRTLVHDFRSDSRRKMTLQQAPSIEAEKVEYPERIPFGSLLTYAKKGEISLQGSADATDKLYIDRFNVLVQGSEHRKEILQELSKRLNREVTEEDFYPLFNYGQKLRGYVPGGKNLSDFISSHGNFALYYDNDKGWTILKLAPQLELRLVEAYWSTDPKMVNGATSLTTSRATLISGGPDSLLQFQISTGTPTRGQIFAADEMIEAKMKTFADIHGFRLVRSVGNGAEGLLYLAIKNQHKYYIKSPDGQLADEEIATIEAFKKQHLIPAEIRTYPDDRMVVMPEYAALPVNRNGDATPVALVFEYLRKIYESGYLCLDLTPEHVRIDPAQQRVFLIDFSGYVKADQFRKQPAEFLADRKKIEYRTPEEFARDFRDTEKFQIYLLGLLLFQLVHDKNTLPYALKSLGNGSGDYAALLAEDLKTTIGIVPFQAMLAYDPADRKTFAQLQPQFARSQSEIETFWKTIRND